MEKLKEALEDYVTRTEGMARIPEFVSRIKEIDDISSFVMESLSGDQIKGRTPIFYHLRKETSPVRLDLYWNSVTEVLELDWDDANPYKLPHRCVE
jgi:hypothetical protein